MPATPPPQVPLPDEPVRFALIGAGARSQDTYQPLLAWLKPWMELVAVCDPVAEHADAMAAALHVPAFHDLRQLVASRPMEAAVVVTPIPSHHSISVYLSRHGIHNHVETAWCSMVAQGRDMVAAAQAGKVICRVAENFFRYPIDRFAAVVRDSGHLGAIKRIFVYNDHTGYHSASRWIAFARAHPLWVQAIGHEMEHPPFRSRPTRLHQREVFRARFIQFPDGLMAIDQAANIKGFLGRHPRPGYAEWQGTRGTLVHRATGHAWGDSHTTATELRRCSEEAFEGSRTGRRGHGRADQVTPVHLEIVEGCWCSIYADTPTGRLQYVNPYRPDPLEEHRNEYYGSAILDHLVDFALAVRGLRKSEFDERDALMSLMTEVGARQSALEGGRRVSLPLEGPIEADALEQKRQQQLYGVDPMDVEGMLSISFPPP
jgi:hypothetical protein